jgi:hypothetical protein
MDLLLYPALSEMSWNWFCHLLTGVSPSIFTLHFRLGYGRFLPDPYKFEIQVKVIYDCAQRV